jgi:hypothetical protein
MDVTYHRDKNLVTYRIQVSGNKSRRVQLPLRGPAEGHSPLWERRDKVIKRTVAEIIASKYDLKADSVNVTIKPNRSRQ